MALTVADGGGAVYPVSPGRGAGSTGATGGGPADPGTSAGGSIPSDQVTTSGTPSSSPTVSSSVDSVKQALIKNVESDLADYHKAYDACRKALSDFKANPTPETTDALKGALKNLNDSYDKLDKDNQAAHDAGIPKEQRHFDEVSKAYDDGMQLKGDATHALSGEVDHQLNLLDQLKKLLGF